jgi:hypothetical protein
VAKTEDVNEAVQYCRTDVYEVALRGIPDSKAVTLYTVLSETAYHNKSMNDFLSIADSGPFRKMQNRKKLSTVNLSVYVHTLIS